jgi:uncharacterized membrane protein YgaE (UPF0421/DUF939 family)
MRKDLVAAGAATVVLMLIVTRILMASTLPVPDAMTRILLAVVLVGFATLVLGLILPGRRPKERRDRPDGERI